MPFVGLLVEVARLAEREEIERPRVAAEREPQSGCDRERACRAGVEAARLHELGVPCDRGVDVRAGVAPPAIEQRLGIHCPGRIGDERIDGRARLLDQPRPLLDRGRGRGRQRAREVTRESRLPGVERGSRTSLDQRGGQQTLRLEPVEGRIADRRKALRRGPFGDDLVRQPVGAAERDARGVRIAARGDGVVHVGAIDGKVVIPLLAQRQLHEPFAPDRSRHGLIAVAVEECLDLWSGRGIVEPALEPRCLDIRIQRISLQVRAVGASGRRHALRRLRVSVQELLSNLDRKFHPCRPRVRSRTTRHDGNERDQGGGEAARVRQSADRSHVWPGNRDRRVSL